MKKIKTVDIKPDKKKVFIGSGDDGIEIDISKMSVGDLLNQGYSAIEHLCRVLKESGEIK